MGAATRNKFLLDSRLANDSVPVERLGLCELRLMDDRRWPWLVLVPLRPDVEEVHDLTPLDQAMLTFETNMVALSLKTVSECAKINTAALGNMVRQLHVHVVARSPGDPNWPGPIWGFGARETYEAADRLKWVERVRAAL